MNDNVLIYNQNFSTIQEQDLSSGSIIVCLDENQRLKPVDISWVVLTYHGKRSSNDERGFFYEKEDAIIFAENLK